MLVSSYLKHPVDQNERQNKASYKISSYDKSPSILYVRGIWTLLRQWDATQN